MKLRFKKDYLKVFLSLALIVIIVIGLVLLLRFWEQQHYSSVPTKIPDAGSGENEGDDWLDEEDNGLDEAYYNDQWYVKKAGLETILLMGVDKYKDDDDWDSYINPQQCDFIMAIILDHNNKTYTPLHINRDTMTNINILDVNGQLSGSMKAQIALSHTFGTGGADSCQNTVDAVSQLLSGEAIAHYISVTMDAIPIVNDAVGGVKVTVMDDFSNIRSDFIQGEEITLIGEQALAYVRVRKGLQDEDDTNLHRMERQRQYMSALKSTFESKIDDNPGLVLSVLMGISDYMVSDCDIYDLSDIANNALEYEAQEIRYLKGEAVLGERFVEFYYDEDALNQLILELYYEPKGEDE